MTDLPDNVTAFIAKASDAWGRLHAEHFSQDMWQWCAEIQSPIEQMFFVALHLVCEVNAVGIKLVENVSQFPEPIPHQVAILVSRQWSVERYRVDFALCEYKYLKRIVCVELDGHEFHDRDERQRRYEKTRDRFLTVKGYRVLHFTGSEVVRDPCAVALEAFNLATGLSEVAIHPFDDG